MRRWDVPGLRLVDQKKGERDGFDPDCCTIAQAVSGLSFPMLSIRDTDTPFALVCCVPKPMSYRSLKALHIPVSGDRHATSRHGSKVQQRCATFRDRLASWPRGLSYSRITREFDRLHQVCFFALFWTFWVAHQKTMKIVVVVVSLGLQGSSSRSSLDRKQKKSIGNNGSV